MKKKLMFMAMSGILCFSTFAVPGYADVNTTGSAVSTGGAVTYEDFENMPDGWEKAKIDYDVITQEKTDQTNDIMIKLTELDKLDEDFDKDIYVIIENIYNYRAYGVTLDKAHNYTGTITVPAGDYILSDAALVSGPAVDYFAFSSEITCPPGQTEEWEVPLHSQRVEEKKAKQREQRERDTQYGQDVFSENREGKNEKTVGELPENPKATVNTAKKDILAKVISFILATVVIGILWNKYRKKKEKEREEMDED